jgi:hypothetical protein
MDMRARPITLRAMPSLGQECHQGSDAPGRPFLHLFRYLSQTLAGNELAVEHAIPDLVRQAALNAKLRGHYQYYGRPTNFRSLWKFYREVRRTWKKWLGRRTRGRPLTWEKYAQILNRHPLHRPRIVRPWAGAVRPT